MMLKAFRSYCLSAFALLTLLTPVLNAQVRQHAMAAPSPDLRCSPAPCVLRNVQVSGGGRPVLSNVIVANPSDSRQMMVGVEDWNCHSLLGIFSTQDGGATWSHTCLPVRPNGLGVGAPIVGYDLNGVAYAGGLQEPVTNQAVSLVLWSSVDNGVTWGEPAVILDDHASKPWLEVDTNPASPFKNTLYVTATRYSQQSRFYFSNITVSHSADGGKTWNTQTVDRVLFPIVDYFSDLAVASDGNVYLTWLRCKARGSESSSCGGTLASVWIAKSADGGISWSAPVEVAQPRLVPDLYGYEFGELPGTEEPVSAIPVVAVDTSGQPTAGNVYVAFYNYNGRQMQVCVVTSRDGGTAWSAPVRVSGSNRGDEFFHWISVASNGTLGVTWLDRSANYFDYQPAAAFSTDCGGSFSVSTPLSTTLSDPNKIFPSFLVMGDYRTHVWIGNTLYAAWLDTRTGNGEVELGGAQF